jgi:MFS transporter, ACS family, D-galactonate transporter
MAKVLPQKGGWVVVTLLFFFMLINFVDKAVIGLAAVPMMKELHLTPKEFGVVNSSFFALFSISAIVTGFIVNRIQARWALLVMALVWALTQFPMAGTIGFAGVIACRVVLGAGEGPAYPVALHAAYKFFPNELRALPTAVIAQGAAIGVTLAMPVLGYVVREYSWHAAFGLLGVIGLLWVAAWYLFGKEGSLPAEIVPEAGARIEHVSYWRLLFNPTTLSGFVTGFGAYWGLSLLVGWFTPYLIQGLHYPEEEAHWITVVPWAAAPFIVITAGWFSQRLVTRGVGTNFARGVFGSACVVFGGICMLLLPSMPNNTLRIAMVVLGIAVPSVIYVMGHAMVSEFTPVPQRSAMLCINNAVATFAGVVAPYVMGSVVQGAGASPAEGYAHGFFICGIVSVAGGAIGMIFLRPQREVARFAAEQSGGERLAPAAGE